MKDKERERKGETERERVKREVREIEINRKEG